MAKVNVTGITPAAEGDDWFLIDQSGEFSINETVDATIWLVGGGLDGTAGVWNGNDVDDDYEPIPDTGTGVSYSGDGGSGGYVFTLNNIEINKNNTLTAVIADRGDFTGTSLEIDYILYKCNDSGSKVRGGGSGGSLPLPSAGEKYVGQENAILPTAGSNGVETPYGYVGSSGGGGAVCDGTTNADNGIEGGIGAGSGTSHRSAGTDATNYGCGGGGGAVCGKVAKGYDGGKGKKGCIIIQYTLVYGDDDSGGGSGSGGSGSGGSGDGGSGGSGSGGSDSDSGGSSGSDSGGSSGSDSGGSSGGGSGSTTEPQKTLVIQKHYKRVCNTKNTYNTDYYSNNSKHSCCNNIGCSCGGSNANASSYTDSVRINMGTESLKSRIATLTSELESANAERVTLQSKIDELQAKLDSLSDT